MPLLDCRHFNGYKPCGLHAECAPGCPSYDRPAERILIVHLGAIGAVLRSTSLLRAIKRKYPSSHLTWVTKAPADQLLRHNPLIDKVLPLSLETELQLRTLFFTVGFVIDKDPVAAGILKGTKVDRMFGFTVMSRTGAIVPLNEEANELWNIGLSDKKKFFENKKPETQLVHEALALGPYQRDNYFLPLTLDEIKTVKNLNCQWRIDPNQPVIGINTGCSDFMPAKKLTIEFHRKLIQEMNQSGLINIVLLGGKEDTERNAAIAKGLPVILSETQKGLRNGALSVDACDVVVTGDSLGMHLAIARKKFVVAWFGPTCAHEIDLYQRGVKVLTQSQCSPCWKRVCQQSVMCYDEVSLSELMAGVDKGIQWWRSRNLVADVQAVNAAPTNSDHSNRIPWGLAADHSLDEEFAEDSPRGTNHPDLP